MGSDSNIAQQYFFKVLRRGHVRTVHIQVIYSTYNNGPFSETHVSFLYI